MAPHPGDESGQACGELRRHDPVGDRYRRGSTFLSYGWRPAAGVDPRHPRVSSTQPRRDFLLTAEKVTVSSWAGLRNGQQVTVSVQGFKPGQAGGNFLLSECATPMQVNHPRCGMQLALQSIGLTDSNVDGSGSVSFTVHSSAATEPLSSALVPCSGSCIIVATPRSHGNYGFAPISFAGQQRTEPASDPALRESETGTRALYWTKTFPSLSVTLPRRSGITLVNSRWPESRPGLWRRHPMGRGSCDPSRCRISRRTRGTPGNLLRRSNLQRDRREGGGTVDSRSVHPQRSLRHSELRRERRHFDFWTHGDPPWARQNLRHKASPIPQGAQSRRLGKDPYHQAFWRPRCDPATSACPLTFPEGPPVPPNETPSAIRSRTDFGPLRCEASRFMPVPRQKRPAVETVSPSKWSAVDKLVE